MLFDEWNLEDALAVEREEGREEGLEQGLEQGREEVARNLKAIGVPVEQIVRGTGLTEAQVWEL